jgi:hypothetical protein
MLRVKLLYAFLLSITIQSPEWTQLPAKIQVLAAQLGINAGNFAHTLLAIDKRAVSACVKASSITWFITFFNPRASRP